MIRIPYYRLDGHPQKNATFDHGTYVFSFVRFDFWGLTFILKSFCCAGGRRGGGEDCGEGMYCCFSRRVPFFFRLAIGFTLFSGLPSLKLT